MHNHAAGAGDGVAPGVGGDVVDCVVFRFRCVDDEKPQAESEA